MKHYNMQVSHQCDFSVQVVTEVEGGGGDLARRVVQSSEECRERKRKRASVRD